MDNGIEKLNIQWFPGHMTKAGRMISENVGNVDAVCEILDARIPLASRNPDVDTLTSGKPRLVILNRTDLADPRATALWRDYFKRQGMAVLETDCKSGKGVNGFAPAVRALLKNLLEQRAAKGQASRALRVMVLGIPNVGKSTFINRVAGKKAAAVSRQENTASAAAIAGLWPLRPGLAQLSMAASTACLTISGFSRVVAALSK